MSAGFPQLKARPSEWRKLFNSAQDNTASISRSSALVFAPHQDDETLGCGGTIIKKCRAGAKVSCVFMTDGRTSHQALLPPDELARLREHEAITATELLGIPREHVHFLRFEDGRLGSFHTQAVEKVSGYLQTYRPDEVYLPYRKDGTPDHESTFRIVSEALRTSATRTKLYEYPVWFWNQWPWVPMELRPGRNLVKAFRRSWSFGFGRVASDEFSTSVFVGDVLGVKKKALEAHRSQMSALRPGTAWPTLHEVSGGAFLECFFRDFELFRMTPGRA